MNPAAPIVAKVPAQHHDNEHIGAKNLNENENAWGEFNVSEYAWGSSLKLHELLNAGSYDELKTSILGDAASFGVIAALSMTISVGLLSLGTRNNSENNSDETNIAISYLFILSANLSTWFSFRSIMYGMQRYLHFNFLPSKNIRDGMKFYYENVETSLLKNHAVWFYLSSLFLAVAISLYVFALYGPWHFVMSIVIGVYTVVVMISELDRSTGRMQDFRNGLLDKVNTRGAGE